MNRLNFFIIGLVLTLVSCTSEKYKNLSDGLYADIETTKGDILLSLEYKEVPITTANFVSLAEGTNLYVQNKYKGKRFYDGLTFHSVVADFMIQGGDPNGNGSGGPGYEFENEHPKKQDSTDLFVFDKPGILAMANGGRDANGSQFFITNAEYQSLNGSYTIFGHVVLGQDVVENIAVGDKMNRVKIIRIGNQANQFDASKVFTTYFAELEEKARLKNEKIAKLKAEFLKDVEVNKLKADSLQSGLKMLIIEEGSGIKPRKGTTVRINYAGYFTDGNLFDTSYSELARSMDKHNARKEEAGLYNPFQMVYSEEATLVPGFREGMLNMNYGDKAMLFIPSHLGYGSQGSGSIPPNTDLIFVIEVVDESQDQE